MARTRGFDTEVAVSRAMELFWMRGYEATSLRDLTQHLGIGQGSLYAAFGDKQGLYRAALEHYRANPVAVKPDDTRHAALLACRSSIVSMVAGCGSLIHAFWGSAGGTGLRRNRSGWAA